MLSVVCDKATVVEIVSCVAGDISAAVVNSMSAEKKFRKPVFKNISYKMYKKQTVSNINNVYSLFANKLGLSAFA